MSTTNRQNNLLVNQDWKTIYQTFKNVDFKSYDFENIRRVIVQYIREKYPEDFNDYIESSEYVALIDAIAFMGQSISFRLDLASRENFIDLAETKESVLRLARLLSYNAKRNIPASGLLKFDTISTTDDVLDSKGVNLSGQVIIWNDSTNQDWFEQFTTILNSAMISNVEIGRSQGTQILQGIRTDQYRFNSNFLDVAVLAFDKTVASRRTAFEIVSTSFIGKDFVYEEPPQVGNQLGFIYKQDGQGPGSVNNGFFLLVKQGSIEVTDFTIDLPTPNEIINVDVENINNDDVWLYSLDSNNQQSTEWTKVESLIGNNIAFNSISSDTRNIYNIITKDLDKIDLVFADGVYGNLPQGSFRLYYRVSNGLSYIINPSDMRGINISIPYFNKQGVAHELTISLSAKTTISNAAESEDIDNIRTRAPSYYYIQNRMITAEDYNLAPLTASQDIVKIKSLNRISSGVSRNLDIVDPTGKYSNTNLFADDGIIYKNFYENRFNFSYTNRFDIINFIKSQIEPIIDSEATYNFYISNYPKILFSSTDSATDWVQITSDINQTTGYFVNRLDQSLLKTGIYTNNTLRYLSSGALIKFAAPAGKAFKKGSIVDINIEDPDQTNFIWTKVVRITGDGTNAGRGILPSGLGPVIFSDIIPTGAIAIQIVPKFVTNLSDSFESEIVNLMSNNFNFGIRFDQTDSTWKIVTASNIDLFQDFSLGTAGDTSESNLDRSWLISFERRFDQYSIVARGLDYIFESQSKVRFYFDKTQKIYDPLTGKSIRDQIKVLGINSDKDLIQPLKNDKIFTVFDTVSFEDGYSSNKEVKLTFLDSDDDGVIDNPDSFEEIVGLDLDRRYIFFKRNIDAEGYVNFEYFSNSNDEILIVRSEDDVDINLYENNQRFYFFIDTENVIKRLDKDNSVLIIDNDYRALIGRAGLKFQYIHNANVDRRIDPSVSNIIDVYVLTRNYDTAFRNYIRGIASEPTAPSGEDLRIAYGEKLSDIKAISDEIIFNPVRYKILFGSKAQPELRSRFKVVKNSTLAINDNNLKVRIISAMNEFFAVENWDFGDRFYLAEMVTYIINKVAPDISNIVIVPLQSQQSFGNLFEIQSEDNEIFINGATVDDIEIVSAITAEEVSLRV